MELGKNTTYDDTEHPQNTIKDVLTQIHPETS